MTILQGVTMPVSDHRSMRALPVAAMSLALLITACGGGDTQPSEAAAAPTPPALGAQDVAVAEERDLTPGVLLSGSLEPVDVVPLNAQVAGTVGEVHVDRGTPVRRGQVLAVIEAAGVRSAAQGAAATVAAARAAVALADRQLDAARLLREAGAMADIDFRAAESSAAAAHAQLASAEAQAVSAGEDARRATITAPITGIISARVVEPGQPIRVGDPMLTVVNASILELAGQVPVESARAVRIGQAVRFTIAGADQVELEGTVARKDPVADPGTRQVGVYVRVPNASGQLTGGQFVRGRVVTDRVERAIVIPIAAVRGDSAAHHVLVVAGDTLVRREVRVGPRDDATGMIVVVEGIAVGEMVLTTPGDRLTAGMAVQRPTATPAASADTATGGR